jgi:hypothetical protein
MFDQEGRVTGESRVASFDAASGVLELASPLPELPQSEPPLRG